MKKTNSTLQALGIQYYETMHYNGRLELFVSLGSRDLGSMLSAIYCDIANGFVHPTMVMYDDMSKDDRDYVPIIFACDKQICVALGAKIRGVRGFVEYLVHYTLVSCLTNLDFIRGKDMKGITDALAAFNNELQYQSDKGWDECIEAAQEIDKGFDEVEAQPLQHDEPPTTTHIGGMEVDTITGEVVVYAPVGTVDVPVEQYSKREYSHDVKEIRDVVVYVRHQGIGLLEILRAMNDKGYDSKRYGKTKTASLKEYSKVLHELDLIDISKNGYHQMPTEEGLAFGLRQLHLVPTNDYFWNIYNADVVAQLGELWHDAGLMVQDGVYYKIRGEYDYDHVELPF